MITAQRNAEMLRVSIAIDCYRDRLKGAVNEGMIGKLSHDWIAEAAVRDADALIKALGLAEKPVVK